MSRTNYLNAKNGIEILHKDGLTQILAGDGDPSIFGLEASIGSIFLRSDNGGGIYTKISSDLYGWIVTASGINTENFLQLLDTPSSFDSYGEFLLRVNSAASGIEFINTIDCGSFI
jgi:hypothetical protein